LDLLIIGEAIIKQCINPYPFIYFRVQKQKEESSLEVNEIDNNSHIELSNIERESCKANFLFYDKAK